MASKRGVQIGRLDTVGAIISEMGRVYRVMRREQLDTLDGSRLINALTQIRHALEEQEFERRIRALEEHDAANIGGPTSATGATAPLGNGANGHASARAGTPVGPDPVHRR